MKNMENNFQKNGNMMNMKLLSFILLITTIGQGAAVEPFSLKELKPLQTFALQKPSFAKATDGIDLAYYAYVPKMPKANLIFYHGAGFYGDALYQQFAKELAEKYQIGCYLFDIRGHGYSQGDRGDAPSINQVWDDVTTAIDMVHRNYPNTPIYVGGHSSGAGLVLNYSNHHEHPAVKGYLFIAPYLGRNSGTLKDHTDPNTSFVKSVRVWVFILNGITGGYFFGHTPAVYFNYPQALLENDSVIVTNYTATMMSATSPEAPQPLFAQLKKPFALLAAAEDEQFIPEKLVAYKDLAPANIAQDSVAQIIPLAKHLDIMLSVARPSATFIEKNNQ